eukprot:5166823-Alexandrium_andersonii.AAC.1
MLQECDTRADFYTGALKAEGSSCGREYRAEQQCVCSSLHACGRSTCAQAAGMVVSCSTYGWHPSLCT